MRPLSTRSTAGERDIPVDTVIRFQDGTTQRIRTTLRVVDLARRDHPSQRPPNEYPASEFS